ncbi:MAG: Nif3-like dinuclear metal center hexameric protein [Eubacteriales bacterium]|nr:Nif3-like dinuclear metal center hexameric protein [Eubacteriales bacterium]
MKKATIQAVYDWIDGIAPFLGQEEFDNAGLQVGRPDNPVAGILLALDTTPDVIAEARERGCDLIISHHPLVFMPLLSLRQDYYVPRVLSLLIQGGIGLIAAHTNLDKSAYSGSMAVMKRLNMQNIRRADDYTLVGDLPRAIPMGEVQVLISLSLKSAVLRYGDAGKEISTLAVAGGAYSEGFQAARAAGAEAFLTGEVRHHHAVEAADTGIALFEAGHFATEQPMMEELAQGLQSGLNALNYNVQVYVSRQIPYLRE